MIECILWYRHSLSMLMMELNFFRERQSKWDVLNGWRYKSDSDVTLSNMRKTDSFGRGIREQVLCWQIMLSCHRPWIYTPQQTQFHTYAYIRTHTQTQTWTHARANIDTHKHINTHTHTHIYIYIYIYGKSIGFHTKSIHFHAEKRSKSCIVWISIFVFINQLVPLYTYIHIHVPVHIFKYTNTHKILVYI